MSAVCPACSTRLPWDKLRGAHDCPSCHTALALESDASIALCVVLWTVAELPLLFLLPSGLFRLLLSFCLGMGIWSLICASAKTTASIRTAGGAAIDAIEETLADPEKIK